MVGLNPSDGSLHDGLVSVGYRASPLVTRLCVVPAEPYQTGGVNENANDMKQSGAALPRGLQVRTLGDGTALASVSGQDTGEHLATSAGIALAWWHQRQASREGTRKPQGLMCLEPLNSGSLLPLTVGQRSRAFTWKALK